MKAMGILLAVLLFTMPAFSFDARATYTQICSGCHGAKGEGRLGFSPKLAGQHWTYTRDQIRDIKSGERDNGGSPMMVGAFEDLKPEDIEAVAKYLEKLK